MIKAAKGFALALALAFFAADAWAATINAGETTEITVDALSELTISTAAVSTATVSRLSNVPAGPSLGTVSLAESSSLEYGPFGEPTRFRIACITGSVSYSTTFPDLATQADLEEAGGGVSDGDKGDITVASSGASWTVDANAIALGTDTTGGYAASVSEAGPATTATALAANGANCSAGSYPLGVDASGAAEGCTVAGGAEASALAPAVVIEGTTADAFEGNFTFADPTADWTWAWGADGTLTGPAGGVVIGPASATDSGLAMFDSTTGKLVKATGNPRVVSKILILGDPASNADSRLNATSGNVLKIETADGLYYMVLSAGDVRSYRYDGSASVFISGDTQTITPSTGNLEVVGSVDIADPGARPTCDSSKRGRFFVDEGGAGVADTVAVCAKDAADNYAWHDLY